MLGFKVLPQLPRDEIPGPVRVPCLVLKAPGSSGCLHEALSCSKTWWVKCCFQFPRGRRRMFSCSAGQSSQMAACLPVCRTASLSSGPVVLWASPHVTSCHRLSLVPSAGVITTTSPSPEFFCVCVLSGKVQAGGTMGDTSRKLVRNEPPLHKSEGNRIQKIKMR